MSQIKSKLKDEIAGVHQEVKNRVVGYIVTALGLVAGLAWNDAIKSLIENYFPAENQGVWAKFVYAILITLLVVIASVYLVRIFKKKEEESQPKKGSK